MNQKVTEQTEAAWVHLIRASQHIHCTIEIALKERGLPGLDWYDVLIELKRVVPADLRPFELQGKLLMKQYNLSRLLARMVEAGVLEKRPCPEDGRGFGFYITEQGIEQQETMWPIYQSVLATEFGDKISEEDAGMLAACLRGVAPEKK